MRGSTAGLADTLGGGTRAHAALLVCADACFASFVVAPAVVGYWHGAWTLTDVYLLPEDHFLSSVASTAFGFTGLLVMSVAQHWFKRTLTPEKHRLSFYAASRIYTALFGLACVSSWRGAWGLLDAGAGQAVRATWATTVAAAAALIAMRAFRNICAAPFAVIVDSPNDYFDVPTNFRTSSRDTALYVLDCVFSVLVVGSLVVFVWRGTWVLLDTYLYPDDEVKSAFGSLVLGYALVALTFALQAPMRWACARLHGAIRVATADVFLLISFLATVNVWRGIWNLLDLYFIPENPELSNWISHGVSFLLLMLLNCSNSVLVRGVYIDAEEPAGECVVFPCHYLRIFFHKERAKKRHRKILLAAAARRKADIEVGPHHHHAPALLPMLEPQLPSDPADADCPTNTLIPTSDTLLRTVIEKV